jgi:hypothetical protein
MELVPRVLSPYQRSGLHSARVVFYSLDFEEIELAQRESRWHDAASVLTKAAIVLKRAGADFLLIYTNTMHKVADEVGESAGLPILHIVDATGNAFREQGLSKVGLLETRFVMAEQFWDESTHTFYDTSDKHENLFVRQRSSYDGALPSGPSAATLVLLKLARLADREQFEKIAMRSLESMQESMRQRPLGFCNWLCGLDLYFSTLKEVAIIGPRDHPKTLELLHILCTVWLPNKVVAAYAPDDPAPVSELKLFKNRKMIDNQPTVYVCEHYTCQASVTDPASLRAQLK